MQFVEVDSLLRAIESHEDSEIPIKVILKIGCDFEEVFGVFSKRSSKPNDKNFILTMGGGESREVHFADISSFNVITIRDLIKEIDSRKKRISSLEETIRIARTRLGG